MCTFCAGSGHDYKKCESYLKTLESCTKEAAAVLNTEMKSLNKRYKNTLKTCLTRTTEEIRGTFRARLLNDYIRSFTERERVMAGLSENGAGTDIPKKAVGITDAKALAAADDFEADKQKMDYIADADI